MFVKFSRGFLLVAMAIILVTLSVVVVGCGNNQDATGPVASTTDNGLIIGGSGTMSGVIPEVGVFSTTVTRGAEVETTFHVEAINIDMVESDLVVYVKYDSEGGGEFVIVREGDYQSEAFEFHMEGKDVTTVAIAPHAERLDVQLPKLVKMNQGGQRIEVTENYIFQHHAYTVDPDNASATK